MGERKSSVPWRAARRVVTTVAVLIVVSWSALPAAGEPLPTEPPPDTPDTEEPVDTVAPPDTTAPADTTMAPSVATTTPASTRASVAVTGDDEMSSVTTIGIVIGIVGIVALLGIAAWWMVRRDDEDDAPHPPGPTSYSDLI